MKCWLLICLLSNGFLLLLVQVGNVNQLFLLSSSSAALPTVTDSLFTIFPLFGFWPATAATHFIKTPQTNKKRKITSRNFGNPYRKQRMECDCKGIEKENRPKALPLAEVLRAWVDEDAAIFHFLSLFLSLRI